MSTARAGWCCSDNSPHRPTVDRSLALCTVPFAATPMPPFCPNTYAAPFSSPPPTLPNAVSSPTLFVCVCQPPSPPPKHPSLRPTRCLSSLYAHPLRRQCRPPVSIRRLPSSLLRTSCGFLRGAAGRRNVCSTVIQSLFTFNLLHSAPTCLARLCRRARCCGTVSRSQRPWLIKVCHCLTHPAPMSVRTHF
jgi:hypothetical protein